MAAVSLARCTAAGSARYGVCRTLRCAPVQRWFSCGALARREAAVPPTSSTSTLRNVSFWGHIDAGKTTLTEKVLYLSNALLPPESTGLGGGGGGGGGSSSAMMPGDVDSGSTVTDFLEAERQRGITIQSAAVGPFQWTTKLLGDESGTATAAAVRSDITLIDTPGHIDFTIEVERSLRVADGCVVLIDGVEGVESQTEGVWRIAQRYNLRSHIVFINKMDRMGSSLVRSMRSIVTKGLHARPTLLQLPIFSATAGSSSSSSTVEQQALVGLVDLTSMPLRAHFFGGRAGEDVTSCTLEEAVTQQMATPALLQEAQQARAHIIEQVANLDETLLEQTFTAMEASEGESSNVNDYTVLISAASFRQAIRRLVVRGEILPVLCGSAAKGVGVQAVLDAIAAYLPSPGEAGDFDAAAARQQSSGCVWGLVRVAQDGAKATAILTKKQAKQQKREKYSASVKATAAAPAEVAAQQQRDQTNVSVSIADATLSLLAFKVVWDKRRGPMTFVRIYSGTLTHSSILLNTSTGARERLAKILHVYADRHVETNKLTAGQIGVLIGLKDTRTGDTLVDVRAAAQDGASARKGKLVSAAAAATTDVVTPWQPHAVTLTLRRVNVPPPVFSMSVEALSKSDEGAMREALDMLIRTDPSLHLDQGGGGGTSSSGGAAALGSAAASTGGQVVLSGMGELHLEIARDRLIEEFGARAHLGNVRVSYRETTVGYGSDDEAAHEVLELDAELDRTVMGQKLKAACRISIRPLAADEVGETRLGGNLIVIDQMSKAEEDDDGGDAAATEQDDDDGATTSLDDESVRRAIQSGLLAALSRGPLSGNPVTGLHVCIDEIQSFGSSLSPVKAFSLLAAQAIKDALKHRGTVLMEPFMDVRIRCDDEYMGKVVSNLTSEQDGSVQAVTHDDDVDESASKQAAAATTNAGIYLPSSASVDGPTHVDEGDRGGGASASRAADIGKCTISAIVPLVKLVRYSSTLRALTRGKATYEMAFSGFAVVSPERQRALLVDLGRL